MNTNEQSNDLKLITSTLSSLTIIHGDGSSTITCNPFLKDDAQRENSPQAMFANPKDIAEKGDNALEPEPFNEPDTSSFDQ